MNGDSRLELFVFCLSVCCWYDAVVDALVVPAVGIRSTLKGCLCLNPCGEGIRSHYRGSLEYVISLGRYSTVNAQGVLSILGSSCFWHFTVKRGCVWSFCTSLCTLLILGVKGGSPWWGVHNIVSCVPCRVVSDGIRFLFSIF